MKRCVHRRRHVGTGKVKAVRNARKVADETLAHEQLNDVVVGASHLALVHAPPVRTHHRLNDGVDE